MPAVNWLASVLPEAPLEVIETDAEGKETAILDHKLPKLWSRPNPFFSVSQLCDAIALSWIVNGNGYFIKLWNALGEPVQLWWVPPYLMYPWWPDGPSFIFIDHYEYRVEGAYLVYKPEQILHFRNMLDHRTLGRTGISPLASGMREIVGDGEWANYQVQLAKNSGVPPFILSPRSGVGMAGITPEEKKFIVEDFERRRRGDNRGKSLFLPVSMDAKRIGQNPKELLLEELRYGGQEMISSLTGIPAEVLNFGAAARRSTYNNVREANARAYESVAVPTFRRLEDVLDRQLLPDFYPNRIVPPNVRCRFNEKKIRALQEDEDSFSTRVVDQYYRGVIKRMSALEKLGYPFDPKLDDIYYTDIVGAKITERINVDDPGGKPGDETFQESRTDLEKDQATSGSGKDGKKKDDETGPAKSRQSVSTGRKNLETGNLPSTGQVDAMERSWIQKAPAGGKKLFRRKPKG
jgi:HK97 family phage portal protein